VIIAKDNQPLVRVEVFPQDRCRRRIGQAKYVILHMAHEFDAPPDDFRVYEP